MTIIYLYINYIVDYKQYEFLIKDSGASVTVVNSDALLHNLDQYSKTPTISSPQSILMNCTGKGTLKLKFYDQSIIDIPAYVLPEVENNLLSTNA